MLIADDGKKFSSSKPWTLCVNAQILGKMKLVEFPAYIKLLNHLLTFIFVVETWQKLNIYFGLEGLGYRRKIF